MNLVSTLLTGRFNSPSANKFNQSSANLKVNGILIDFSFTVPADKTISGQIEKYSGKWDFLRDISVTVALRIGSGNGTAIQLISACSAYQLLAYSDFVGGVSMASTDFKAGSKVRISGYLDIGYFAMGAKDALECSLTAEKKPVFVWSDGSESDLNLDFTVSAVYEKEKASVLKTYQSATPTGADMPYTNVLEIMYDGDATVNKDCVITDQTTTQSCNIEDAIALSNAKGRYEFFTRCGIIYVEPHGISQNLSFKVPKVDGDRQELLIVGLSFHPELLLSNAAETGVERTALLEKIKQSDAEKYQYLQNMGIA